MKAEHLPPRATSRVQSLERGLDILEHAGRMPEGVGVRALAAQLGLPPPTVHNLMQTLAARRYLVRTEHPVRYRLGQAAHQLAGQAEDGSEPAAVALLALQRRFPAAVLTWAVPAAADAVVRLRVSPDAPGVLQRPLAQMLSPYGSATALLFQALWPADQQAAFRQAHPFWEQAAPLWRTPHRLAAFLSTTRRRDHALCRFRGDELLKIAVPIRRQHALAAALGAAWPARQAPPQARRDLLAALTTIARELENRSEPC